MKLYWELEVGDELQEGDEMRWKWHTSALAEAKEWQPCIIHKSNNTLKQYSVNLVEYRRPYAGPIPNSISEAIEITLKRKITI